MPYKITARRTPAKRATAETRVAADYPSVLSSKPPEKKSKAKRKRALALPAVEPAAPSEIAQSPKQEGRIIKVRRGDSLWRIARRHLGRGKKWAAFYKANKDKIDNPDRIFPGQVLILPG